MTTQDKALELAHRIAWRYKKSSDPNHSDTWTFNKDTLLQFVAAILQPASGMPPRIVALLEEVIECNWQCPDGLPLADDARKALYCKDSHEASLKYIEGWEACKRAQPASVPSSMIDSLWNSSEVMALNAELGLTMDQLARLARVILSIAPQPAQAECTRSHPHENMGTECEALTVKARAANAAARAVPKASTQPPLTSELVAAALLLKRWAEERNEPLGWHIAGIGAVETPQPAQAAHVGDTKFEGWLSCFEPDRNQNRTQRYSKQDMRNAYWAGYCEQVAAPHPVQAVPGEQSDAQFIANRLSAYASSGGVMDDCCRSVMRQGATLLRAPLPAQAQPSIQDLAAGAHYPQLSAWGAAPSAQAEQKGSE